MAQIINTTLTSALGLSTSFWAIGFLAALVFFPGQSGAARWIISALLSILATTIICLVAGLAGALTLRTVLFAYLIISVVLIAAALKKGRSPRGRAKARPSWPGLLVAAILIIIAVRAAIYPLTAWDTLMRYAPLGKLFAREGRIFYPPVSPSDWLLFSEPEAYPPLIPLLFTWIFLFSGSDYGARLIGPVFLALTCAAIAATAREVSGRSSGSAVAPLLFLAFPAVIFYTLLHNGYTDQPILFFYVCSLYFTLRLKEGPGSTCLLGIALGLALLTKYSAFFLIPGILLTALALGEGRKATEATLLGLLVALAWYLRSYLITGNPFHPLFFSTFGDGTGSIDGLIYLDGFSRFTAPATAVLGKTALWTFGRNGSILVSALALLELARGRGRKIDLILCLWLVLVLSSSLLMRRPEIRFGLFAFVILSLLAARFLAGTPAPVRRIALGLVLALILIQNSGIAPRRLFSMNYFEGATLSQEDKKLAFLGEDYRAWQYMNSLPEDSAILTPDNRFYYIERRVLSLKNPLVREILYEGDIKKAGEILRKNGITHVMAYDPARSPIGGILIRRSALFRSPAGLGGRTVLEGKRYRLLRIDPK